MDAKAAVAQPNRRRERATLLRLRVPELERRDGAAVATGPVGGAGPCPPAIAPSRRLVTVLFTDIVDSTRWIASLGDSRWLDLHEEHEALMRRTVQKYRGSFLRSLGDGFVV